MRSAIALAWIAAAGMAAAQPSPVIKSETRVVLVDAVVTGKKGEIVRDLTAKDFHVWEDKKEQTIQSVSLESAARQAPGAEAAPTYLTLLFDYTGMDAGDQARARQAAAGFIDANIGPGHLLAVAAYDGELRIEQGFSANAGRLKDVINSPAGRAAGVNNAAAGTGALADLGTRHLFQALESLAASMSAAPGRKAIVFLAGGIALGNEQKGALNAAIEACNKSNVAVYPVDVRVSAEPDALAADSNPAPQAVVRGRPGAGVSWRGGSRGATLSGDTDPSLALDPGGASQQVLYALANGTGGFVIQNAAEMPQGMQKIGEEQGQYYVLSYTPPESKEGACHTLRVKVDRSGATVRARSSYCTGKAQELLTGTAAERDLENHAANAQAGAAAGSMELPFFYVGPNTARVNLVMDIAPGAVKFDRKKGDAHAEVEILGMASRSQGPDDGAPGARFSDTLALNLDDAALQSATPIHYEKEFKVASGQYKMSVVFSSGGDSVGKLELPLTIEPYQPGQLAVSGIAFGSRIRKAGEGGASLFDDKTPLVSGGLELVPAGSNVFTKGGPAYCYFEVYKPEAAGAAGIRIVDSRTGEVKWDGGAIKMDANPKIPVGLNLPIETLAAGSYRLEVRVEQGNQSAARTADFQVK